MVHFNVGVLHYKTIEKTIDCVTSIKVTEPCASIYIIDNYSNDGSLEELKQRYIGDSNIYFICLNDNIGFARANNHCMRLIKAKGEHTIILTNNDIVFKENAISKLISALEATNSVLAAPKVLTPNGVVMDSVQKFRDDSLTEYIWHRILHRLCSPKKFAETCRITASIKTFSGCCFACDLEKMEHIGYMDEHTFLYFEEPILSAKIKDAGMTMVYEPNAEVVHYHGATTKGINEMAMGFQLESQIYYMKNYLEANKFLLAAYVYVKRCIDKRKYHSTTLYKKETDIISSLLSR